MEGALLLISVFKLLKTIRGKIEASKLLIKLTSSLGKTEHTHRHTCKSF